MPKEKVSIDELRANYEQKLRTSHGTETKLKHAQSAHNNAMSELTGAKKRLDDALANLAAEVARS